jgi:methylglutaconyl-CoA hydratase
MEERSIDLTLNGRLGRLVLNRPAAGNAFTIAMMREFLRAVEQAVVESDVLIVSSEGDDFCLGRDRKDHPVDVTAAQGFELVTQLNMALDAFPGIVLAQVQGRAFGFGIGLIMRSDVAIASEDAHFALDEVKLGIPPMFIMAQILNHISEKSAFDLVLSSREITARQACDMGLLTSAVPRVVLADTVSQLAGELTQRDPQVLSACKRYMRAIRSVAPEDRLPYALAAQVGFANRPRDLKPS